jgi:hypothetical protein
MTEPLEGIRVLEMATALQGPAATLSSVAEKDFMEGVTVFVQRRPPNFPRLQIDD